MYNVVCMKWGEKYGPEYVNKLFNMVKRNTTLPFKFVCFTDNPNGLLAEIEVLPLPKLDLPKSPERGWQKLSLFSKNIGLSGRVLFLDLDTVIVSNIDDYFTVEGDIILVKHWNPSKRQGVGLTSVYRFEAGAHPEILDYFVKNIEKVQNRYRHEQAYVCDVTTKANILSFWKEEWMPSFKHRCMYPFPLNFFLEPRLPNGAKMIIFHGNPTPDQAMKGKTKGIKKIFRHVKTPAWLKENWR